MTVEQLDGPDGSYAEVITAERGVFGAVAILHTVFVPPGARGRGHGRRLLEAAEAWAASNAKTEMLVAPVPDRDTPIDVHAWYARHGYRPTRSGVMLTKSIALPCRMRSTHNRA